MKNTINIRGHLFDLSEPKVMGILNVTPDSFYEASRSVGKDEITSRVRRMIEEGADIIDVGGYSSRPGAKPVSAAEEIKRIEPALEIIRQIDEKVIISLDTFRSEVAALAVKNWKVDIINDISGGMLDPGMIDIIAYEGIPYIMMHMNGTPETMQVNPVYEEVVKDIIKWFSGRLALFHDRGVKDIIIDPGFGFGKTTEHNYRLLGRLKEFNILGLPLLAGLSRKSMVWKVLGTDPGNALTGTIALNMVALMNGARILRVHDVKEAVQTVKLFRELCISL